MNQDIASLLVCLTILMMLTGMLGIGVLVFIYPGLKRTKKIAIPRNIQVEEKAVVPYQPLLDKAAIPYKSIFEEEEIEISKPQRLPYRVRDNFLSEAEHSFYHVLRHLLDDDFAICPKVRLLDIFYITGNSNDYTSRNKIDRKHIDFLICMARTMKPVLAIELDDSSHRRQDRVERDQFVNQVFENVRLPLLRIKTREAYNTAELLKDLDKYLKLKVT